MDVGKGDAAGRAAGMTGDRDADRPDVAVPEDERAERAAAVAEAVLAAATLGGLAVFAGTAVYLLRVLGWFG
ncbi:hypothetical protein [Azospirillum halopraeferens]|uniref:hypothetical protein n=1 Tax=Azospirillum halopraeferens TaxID=34010 RepID=UPI000426E19C|nr:hypothetical protein [Azospirillum halopraeferens]